uniref:Predicted dehydrogenase n=1 Tax=Candidatus Kentrum sp. MB TaxID=2138164 RepID=A0A450XRI6_9GAMM|nr:MAG: Predicted dehydrogenase [Candidatus Kentron sp. MB]
MAVTKSDIICIQTRKEEEITLSKPKIRCVRVGFGHIGRIHEQKLELIDVETIGILERSAAKCSVAVSWGLRVLSDYHEAFGLEPDFWDVCTGTSMHLSVLKEIIAIDPHANILVEKPICTLSQITDLKRLLESFHGKIVINENYAASRVTQIVREQVSRLGLRPTRVISEMTKNRVQDILGGRFLDHEHYAFGYEGSHMITNVLGLGDDFLPREISCQSYEDMTIEDDEQGRIQSRLLFQQGASEKRYTARNGAYVILHTAMDGHIAYLYPGPYSRAYIPDDDDKIRYRILAVEDNLQDIVVVGFYEPIPGFERNYGKVIVTDKHGIREDIDHIYDDTMLNALGNALQFFEGNAPNPYPVTRALDNLKMLKLW